MSTCIDKQPTHRPKDPVPLWHVEEEELQSALEQGILFHAMSPDVDEVKALGEIVVVKGFDMVDSRKGLRLIMKDGSEFELTITQTKAPEHEHEDEVV